MDIATFRSIFPEFEDALNYPNGQITIYLGIGNAVILESRWGEYREIGVALFIAHNIALARQSLISGAAGGVPGVGSGVVASKSLGQASISYDTSAGLETDAGNWNRTTYGQRFYRYMRMVGMGGVYV